MRVKTSGLGLLGISAGLVLVSVAGLGLAVRAQDRSVTGQGLIKVDWADAEIVAFKAAKAEIADVPAEAANVQLPVMAFVGVPQLVKNVAGPDAVLIKPRSFVTDPKQPYWYHLADTYDGITIAVDADRRVNVEADSKFQIGGAAPGAAARAKGKPSQISVSDGAAEGMEGIVIEYTVQKFPDIPYTVTIECTTKAKAQCKDLAVITKDQALLGVIAASGK
jgi:hypothetical protein